MVDSFPQPVSFCAAFGRCLGHSTLQILTMAELFAGKQPKIPLVDSASFKKATREIDAEQDKLPF